MRLKRMHKRLMSLLFILLALILLCVNALLVWVVTGPRSLDALTPYVESALAPAGSPYQVKIMTSELIWDGWKRPVGIHVKGVSVLGSKGEVIATFPEIGVQMYFLELLRGRLNVKSLEILHPSILLQQADDGGISLGFNMASDTDTANASLSAVFDLLASGQGDSPVTRLKSLAIEHANLAIKKKKTGVFLRSPDASLEVTRKRDKVTGLLAMPLHYEQKDSELDLQFSLNADNKTITGSLLYTDIPSAVLHALFPAQQWLDSVAMPLSGGANVIADFDAHISALNFTLDAGPGTIAYESELEKPLAVHHIHVAGGLTDKLSTLTVREGLIDFNSVALKFKGIASRKDDDYAVDANVETANVPADDIHLYWPLHLSPHTREWVTRHVSKGTLVKGKAALHFKHGDFKLKDTPEEDIDATLDVKGAQVKYMPAHPPATNIDGTVKFTGRSMDARVTHAEYMTGTEVSAARIRFPDLYPDDVRLFLDMDLKAPAKDVIDFMSLPELNKAQALNLTSAATGRASASAKLDFIAFSDESKPSRAAPGHINYDINAELIDVAQPKFMRRHDVSDANMKVSINNKGLSATGRAKINQLPMQIDLKTTFGKNGLTTYQVKTEMPVARLPDFGLPPLAFARGTMGVDATFTSPAEGADKADATLDITHTSLDLPDYGYAKKMDEQAVLKLSTEDAASGNTLIKSFSLSGAGGTASGKAEYDRKLSDFSMVSFDTLRLGRQDLSVLEFSRTPKGFTLTAKGRALDASPFLKPSEEAGKDNAYTLDIQVEHLILGDRREMKNVSLTADCGAICHAVAFNAKLPDTVSLAYSISNGTVQASCDNGGELMRMLGVFDNIDDGKMALEGKYVNGRIEGVLSMKDYTLRRAPVLTRIITVASLTGILDTLSGNGIQFSKLYAPFTYGHEVIMLKDAKAHGPALGLTADGTIDLRAGKFDLTGTLIPSYTLNSLVGNIPLIGDLLMGGTGKGIIGINYSVKGDMNDPSISVNPLSALTPGFLRNIFDVFDEPAPDIDKIEADRKKAAEEKTRAAPTTPMPAAAAPQNAPATVPATH